MPNSILVPAIKFVPEKNIYIGLINLCNVVLGIPVLINAIIYMCLYPFTYLRKVKQFIKRNCADKKKIIAQNLFWYKENSFYNKVLANSYCAAF